MKFYKLYYFSQIACFYAFLGYYFFLNDWPQALTKLQICILTKYYSGQCMWAISVKVKLWNSTKMLVVRFHNWYKIYDVI